VPIAMTTRDRGSHLRSNVKPIGMIGSVPIDRCSWAMSAMRASPVFSGARFGSL
jgi:hypothetical protein